MLCFFRRRRLFRLLSFRFSYVKWLRKKGLRLVKSIVLILGFRFVRWLLMFLSHVSLKGFRLHLRLVYGVLVRTYLCLILLQIRVKLDQSCIIDLRFFNCVLCFCAWTWLGRSRFAVNIFTISLDDVDGTV